MNDEYSTASEAVTGDCCDFEAFTRKNKSIKERVDQWFISPLKNMTKHDSVICMMVRLVIFEKYLRYKGHIKGRLQMKITIPNQPFIRQQK